MTFKNINIHLENIQLLMHVCMFGGKKKKSPQNSPTTLIQNLITAQNLSTITTLKLTNLRPVKTLRSCPLCSTGGGKKGKQQANKGNVQVSHFSKEGKLTVRWGNRELRREDIFWSNAIVQPEVTDRHFGTKKKKINTELDAHIFNIWHEWKMRVEYNKRLCISHIPSASEFAISFSSPVKPPSLLKQNLNNLQWLKQHKQLCGLVPPQNAA